MYMFLTEDPSNTEMYRRVCRGETHERNRPGNTRYVNLTSSLSQRDITEEGKHYTETRGWVGFAYAKQFLGSKWAYPSLNQIKWGI
jgi:hypothetical protein